MTTERFTVDSDGKWWDKIKHEYVTLDSLFKLVEELDYTINEMAKTIRIYDDGYIDLNKKYKKLTEENEQLKQRNKRLEYKIQRERNSFTKTHERWSKEAEDKIKELSEENEHLKKQMQRLYNYFVDWHGDIMGANQFSEMWDDVKEDEDWEL